MHALHIALQEGFVHDAVIVNIDGAQAFAEDDVSTRPQVGVAAAFDVSTASGAHFIEVALPNRRALSHVHSFVVDSDTWLAVSLKHDRQFDIRVSHLPFDQLSARAAH
jgi:hypothetical protein